MRTETQPNRSLSRQAALTLAWLSWFLLLGIPVLMATAAIEASLSGGTGRVHNELAIRWFWLNMVFLAVASPASFFWRGHLFRSFREGGIVSRGRDRLARAGSSRRKPTCLGCG